MKSVKINLFMSVILLVVGAILIARGIVLKFPDGYTESSLFGLGCGLLSAGIVSTIVSIRMLRNPSKVEEVELNKKDERNILIREKTNSKVYSIFVYIECFIVIISMLLGKREISLLFSILAIAKLVVWMIVCNDMNKKN
ncbi:hypothetical protein [Metaclostridioides mangenotii]|uniref:hypothetical protein n=1 Tax=Metaclostridioides mangenotii TaxID=1540 RepID=UPI0004898CF8|nr:hypothetical protein [Clostridioides mangenotii]